MRNLVLSDRMRVVAELVPPHSSTVADIGCDHAYVSIHLINNNIAGHVIAMDVRKGPIDIAANNVREFNVTDKVELRLSDGMEKLNAGEADVIVIAGMGGLLMRDILNRGRHIIEGDNPPILVLQPQSDIGEVRTYLYGHSYHITRERMVYEDGKYYTAILAYPGYEPYYDTEEDREYGRYNIEAGDSILVAYLENEMRVYSEILKKLSLNAVLDDNAGDVSARTRGRITDIEAKIRTNREAYRRCTEIYEMRRDNNNS